MSKKKQLPTAQEEEFLDQMMLDDAEFGEEDHMINTFLEVAKASVDHMQVACRLTEIIVGNRNEKLSTADILDVFRKSSATILDCTPLKALFDKV